MNGNKRYLMDTNAIISLLLGNDVLIQLLHEADWIGVSIINQIEFLSFPNLAQQDKDLFFKFKKNVEVIDLTTINEDLNTQIILIRQDYRLKLPDAIVASCAILSNAILITNDKAFAKISNLKSISF